MKMGIQNTKGSSMFLPHAKYVKQTLHNNILGVKLLIQSLLNTKNVKNWSGSPIKDFGDDKYYDRRQ